jgi:hypothetical protein
MSKSMLLIWTAESMAISTEGMREAFLMSFKDFGRLLSLDTSISGNHPEDASTIA